METEGSGEARQDAIRVLTRLLSELDAISDPQKYLQALVHGAARVLAAPYVWIALADRPSELTRWAAFTPENRGPDDATDLLRGLATRASVTPHGTVLLAARDHPTFGDIYAVPLFHGLHTIGALFLSKGTKDEGVSGGDRVIIGLLASRTSPRLAELLAPAHPDPGALRVRADSAPVQPRGRRRVLLAGGPDTQTAAYAKRLLEEAGYGVVLAPSASAAPSLVASEEPHLVLLDLEPTAGEAASHVRRLREVSNVPLIGLLGLGTAEDAAKLLEAGADDVVRKPLYATEFVARVDALMRRITLPAAAAPTFVLNDLSIHFAERRVIVGDRRVRLTATEFNLLSELAAHAGAVLTYEQLLARVWGDGYSGDKGLVRAFVRRLRAKLEDDARSPRYIQNEPGVGYRMPGR